MTLGAIAGFVALIGALLIITWIAGGSGDTFTIETGSDNSDTISIEVRTGSDVELHGGTEWLLNGHLESVALLARRPDELRESCRFRTSTREERERLRAGEPIEIAAERLQRSDGRLIFSIRHCEHVIIQLAFDPAHYHS